MAANTIIAVNSLGGQGSKAPAEGTETASLDIVVILEFRQSLPSTLFKHGEAAPALADG
ncbi:hypothetical protein D3C78_1974810 [compost metagenome]|jgi:hypothetical protein